jgi:hypothetical protein
MQKYILVLWMAIVGLSSCSEKKVDGFEEVDVSKIPISVKIIRIDRELLATKSPAEVSAILKKYPRYAIEFLQAPPDSPELSKALFTPIQNPDYQAFFKETDHVFGDLAALEKEFEEAFKHIKFYYPAFKEPQIMATFTGLANDLYVSDSLVVVSLEAFLGSKAKYRPDQPTYLLNRYDRQYIVPTVIRFFSKKFVKVDPTDQSMVADMVFHGKSNEFLLNMIPNVSDSVLMGYTQQEIANTWEAQDLVYGHFIENKLFFETNPARKDKYLIERPHTNEVGPACPGRIGQWLGWRIVDKYRTENPKITFLELMNNTNAKAIFEQSKYRGEKD